MLVTTQLDLAEYSLAAVERELPALWDGVDVLASRTDSIAISGVPLAASLGRERTGRIAGRGFRPGRPGLHGPTWNRISRPCSTSGPSGSRWPPAGPTRSTRALSTTWARRASRCDRCVPSSATSQQNKAADPEADHHLALRLGREAIAGGTGREGPDAAGWTVVRDLCRAAAGGRVRRTGSAQHLRHRVGGTARRRRRRWPPIRGRMRAPCWPAYEAVRKPSQNRTVSRIVIHNLGCTTHQLSPPPLSRWRNTWISQD